MTISQQIITVALCILGTMITRFMPFIIFKADKPAPKYIQYLGKALPAAIFGMLVVYCFKDVSVFSGSHGLPEAIATLAVAGLYLWRRNMLFSIAGGTVLYMMLVQLGVI